MVPEDSLEQVPYDNAATAAEEPTQTPVLNQLVLHMTSPLHETGHTVNFNNYYASPLLAIQLLQKKVFCRGTVLLNRRLLPKYIMFTNSKVKRPNARGSSKVAVNERYGLVAAWWLDGNPVHLVSSADTERIAEVQRKVGGRRIAVKAPEVVLSYNKGMDGVDRHDQYRAKFSLCSCHGFKKYHVKLYLALLDMCLTNARLHHKMVHQSNAGTGPDFIQSIATLLMSQTNGYVKYCPELRQSNYNLRSLGTRDDINQLFSHQITVQESIGTETKGETNRCMYDSLASFDFKKRSKKNSCQICSFEKRGTLKWKNYMVCRHHKIRACGIKRPIRERNLVVEGTTTPVQDYSWILGDEGNLTCMEKFHTLYLPAGLFSTTVGKHAKNEFATIKRASALYKQRQRALGKTTEVGGRKKGSKNKNNKKEKQVQTAHLLVPGRNITRVTKRNMPKRVNQNIILMICMAEVYRKIN